MTVYEVSWFVRIERTGRPTDRAGTGWSKGRAVLVTRRESKAVYALKVAAARRFIEEEGGHLQHVEWDRHEVAQMSKQDLFLAALNGDVWSVKQERVDRWAAKTAGEAG